MKRFGLAVCAGFALMTAGSGFAFTVEELLPSERVLTADCDDEVVLRDCRMAAFVDGSGTTLEIAYSADQWGALADAGGRRATIRCREGYGYRVIAEDLQGTGIVPLELQGDVAIGSYDLVMTVSDGAQTYDDEALNATLMYANRSIAYDANFRELSASVLSDRALDLAQGVRRPKTRELVFPFAYSITNFTGDVTDATCVRVRIVKVTGEGEDVSEWTEEVPGTARTLFEGVGESTVRWPHPKIGVWLATFDILNGDQPLGHYDSIFDLRDLPLGLAVHIY